MLLRFVPRPVRRLLMSILLIGTTILATPPAGSAATELTLDWPIPNGHHFTQASGFPAGASPMGYAIVDDSQAKLWSEFQRLGGVNHLGYPASQRFMWSGFVTQVTQKAVLQWRPETQSVAFVNVFDDLDTAGKNPWLTSVRSVPRPVAPTFDNGLAWSQVVSHRVDLLRTRPALLKWYQSAPDANNLYGLPESPVVDAGPMYVVRLQRAVLQEWKVKEPWAEVGQVTVANGGDVAKEAAVFPWKAMRPIDSGVAYWPVSSTGYTISGVATWYGPGFVGKPMANGQIYNPNDATTTASNAYPLGSRLKVTARSTSKSIDVWVRDTGKFAYPDVVDLSPAAFTSLGIPTSTGVMSVTVVLADPPGPGSTSNTQAPSSR